MGRDTKFTVPFFIHYVRLQISQPGFTNWREIIHGSSATSRTGLLPFWGDSPRDGRVLGINGALWRGMLLVEALVWN